MTFQPAKKKGPAEAGPQSTLTVRVEASSTLRNSRNHSHNRSAL